MARLVQGHAKDFLATILIFQFTNFFLPTVVTFCEVFWMETGFARTWKRNPSVSGQFT